MGSKLALVRHGETDWNAEGRLQGRMDIALNEVGRGQARAAGRELLAAGGWDVLVSSPLARAAETASLAGVVLGLEPTETLAGLAERDYGRCEGRVVAGLPRHDIDRLLESAEPEDEVADRGVRSLAGLVERYPGRNVVAVAHGTLLRLTLTRILGADHPRFRNGQIVELDAKLFAGARRGAPEGDPPDVVHLAPGAAGTATPVGA